MQEVIFWGIWAVLGFDNAAVLPAAKAACAVPAGRGREWFAGTAGGALRRQFGWHFTCAESAASGTVCCAWRTWCDTDGRAAFYTVNNKKRDTS